MVSYLGVEDIDGRRHEDIVGWQGTSLFKTNVLFKAFPRRFAAGACDGWGVALPAFNVGLFFLN